MRAAAAPFRSALELQPRGGGRYAAALGPDWTVGAKAHGGLLLALLVRAGLVRLGTEGSLAGPSIDTSRAWPTWWPACVPRVPAGWRWPHGCWPPASSSATWSAAAPTR